MSRLGHLGWFGLVPVAAFVATACANDAPQAAPAPSVSAPTRPTVERAFSDAVSSASSAKARPADGPPPDGILPLERANAVAPVGAAPSLELATPGNEPRVLLRGRTFWAPGSTQALQLDVIVPAGQQPVPLQVEVLVEVGMPGADLRVSDTKKPKPSAAVPSAAVPSASAAAVAPPAGPYPAVARVKSAKLHESVMGGAQLASVLERLASVEVHFMVAPSGASYGHRVEVRKDAVGTWGDAILQAVTDLSVAMPEVPVGPSAMWMVISREAVSGYEVVSYRMVTLHEVSDQGLVASAKIRRYAVPSTGPRIEGLPPDARFAGFQSEGEAVAAWGPGPALIRAESQGATVAVYASPSRPEEQLPVQLQTRSMAQPSAAEPEKPGASDKKR